MSVVRTTLPDGRVKVTLTVTPRQIVAIKELNGACAPTRDDRPPRHAFDEEQWALGIRRILDTRDAVALLAEPYNEITIEAEL